MGQTKNTISEVREAIDAIDNQILDLLKERLHYAQNIGRLKGESKRDTWDPARERAIYSRLMHNNDGIFPEQSLHAIFHEIITTCRLSQQQLTVAYLGPEATFTHQAGVRHFGRSAVYMPLESIDDVFHDVEKGRTAYGIVPVENSIEGAVFSTLDSFMKYGKVKICGEIHMPISHNLVSRSGNIDEIKTVASHAQPLAQCREWLKKNLDGTPTLPVFSTGAAAKMAADDPSVAAIASALAIKTYQLQTIVKGIEDYKGNTTRFLIIGRKSPSRSGKDKTSLLLGLMDRPGALNEVLTVLSAKNINLGKIESRPIKGRQWKYLFFIDLLGHIEDPLIIEGCNILRQICAFYECLGSYPQDDPSTTDA